MTRHPLTVLASLSAAGCAVALMALPSMAHAEATGTAASTPTATPLAVGVTTSIGPDCAAHITYVNRTGHIVEISFNGILANRPPLLLRSTWTDTVRAGTDYGYQLRDLTTGQTADVPAKPVVCLADAPVPPVQLIPATSIVRRTVRPHIDRSRVRGWW